MSKNSQESDMNPTCMEIEHPKEFVSTKDEVIVHIYTTCHMINALKV
jgi:hypothetical protein